jgi:hypothetical protein
MMTGLALYCGHSDLFQHGSHRQATAFAITVQFVAAVARARANAGSIFVWPPLGPQEDRVEGDLAPVDGCDRLKGQGAVVQDSLDADSGVIPATIPI